MLVKRQILIKTGSEADTKKIRYSTHSAIMYNDFVCVIAARALFQDGDYLYHVYSVIVNVCRWLKENKCHGSGTHKSY